MKAAVLHAKDDIVYEDYPDPQVEDGDVLVRVKVAGICGSDIPRVLGDAAHGYPIVLGHEFSGEVVETGAGVASVKPGDRVAGVPLIPCFKCGDCRKGDYALCGSYTFIGSRIQGGFADYVKLPENNVVKFDSCVPFLHGAFFEPSTVALHGLLRTAYCGGGDVAVLGSGTIGIFTMQWAKIFGARSVTVFDIDGDRLALASKLGADMTVNTLDPGYMDIVNELTGKKGFEYIYETAGSDVTMKAAFELAAKKSGICFIGTPVKDLKFDPKLFEKMNRKEFCLTGSWMSYSAPFPGREWMLTAHYLSKGALRFDDGMVFAKLPMNEAKRAFDMFKTPGMVKGKVLLFNDGCEVV